MTPEDVPEGAIALDTDVFSMLHVRKGRHREFAELIAGHEIALPFAVVGELKVLPIRARWGRDKIQKLESDMGLATVIPATAAVVDRWAQLSSRFVDRLKSGGVNDMWIAASCLVHNLPLATGNLSDFQTIMAEFPSLRLIHPDL